MLLVHLCSHSLVQKYFQLFISKRALSFIDFYFATFRQSCLHLFLGLPCFQTFPGSEHEIYYGYLKICEFRTMHQG